MNKNRHTGRIYIRLSVTEGGSIHPSCFNSFVIVVKSLLADEKGLPVNELVVRWSADLKYKRSLELSKNVLYAKMLSKFLSALSTDIQHVSSPRVVGKINVATKIQIGEGGHVQNAKRTCPPWNTRTGDGPYWTETKSAFIVVLLKIWKQITLNHGPISPICGLT